MRMKLIFIVAIFFMRGNSNAQVVDDVYYSPKNISDSGASPVDKHGLYFALGIGPGFSSNLNGVSIAGSVSLAIKSHLISATFVKGSSLSGGGDYENAYTNEYAGILLGEALRQRNFMLSLSAGIAYGDYYYRYHINMHDLDNKNYNGITVPVELNMFILAYNGIGFGFHANTNFFEGNSPTSYTVSVVLGIWNKIRK